MSNKDERIRYIMLSQMKGIGPVTQNALLKCSGNINNCFYMSETDFIKTQVDNKIGLKRLKLFLRQRDDIELKAKSMDLLDSCISQKIEIIVANDIRYPDRFKGIPDMPVVLYSKGSLRINEYPNSFGIVGARRCSNTGKISAINHVSNISEDVAIISGLAKGIDSYAHTAAIKNNVYTIAVLGNGVDICYPKEHDKLYTAISELGCILSEYAPGTIPKDYRFPMRNRLIAALSDRLYVIDASKNSGTESTVKNAVKYNREIIRV